MIKSLAIAFRNMLIGYARVSTNDQDTTTVGAFNASLILTDNSLNLSNSTQTLALTGTAIKGTPAIVWATPSITYGTALSATQLNATAGVAGTFVYSPASGTVLTAGAQILSVTFTPTDTTDYYSPTASVQLIVNKTASVLSVTSLRNPSAFGDSVTFTLTVSGNGATPTGTVTLTDGATTLLSATTLQATGIQTVTTSTLSAGNHVVKLTYSGDSNYY